MVKERKERGSPTPIWYLYLLPSPHTRLKTGQDISPISFTIPFICFLFFGFILEKYYFFFSNCWKIHISSRNDDDYFLFMGEKICILKWIWNGMDNRAGIMFSVPVSPRPNSVSRQWTPRLNLISCIRLGGEFLSRSRRSKSIV